MAETRSKFLKVKCPECGGEQTMFSHASTEVKCLVCGKKLAESGPGKARIITKTAKEAE